MENKLTARQEKFCQSIVNGKTQYDAYKAAYSTQKYKDNAIYVNASRLLENTKIQLRISELKKELEKKFLWTREQSVKVLSGIALSTKSITKNSDKVAAIRELNLMHGFNSNTDDETYVLPVAVTIQVKSAKRPSGGK